MPITRLSALKPEAQIKIINAYTRPSEAVFVLAKTVFERVVVLVKAHIRATPISSKTSSAVLS